MGWTISRPVISLSSIQCFTIMTALDGTGKLTDILFVMIAQSSAALVPHILAGCDPCRGVQHVRGSSLENLLHIVLHRNVMEATGKCQGTAAKLFPAPSLLTPRPSSLPSSGLPLSPLPPSPFTFLSSTLPPHVSPSIPPSLPRSLHLFNPFPFLLQPRFPSPLPPSLAP